VDTDPAFVETHVHLISSAAQMHKMNTYSAIELSAMAVQTGTILHWTGAGDKNVKPDKSLSESF